MTGSHLGVGPRSRALGLARARVRAMPTACLAVSPGHGGLQALRPACGPTVGLATPTPRHHSGQSRAVSYVGQGPATSSCWPQDHHPEGVPFSFEVTHCSQGPPHPECSLGAILSSGVPTPPPVLSTVPAQSDRNTRRPSSFPRSLFPFQQLKAEGTGTIENFRARPCAQCCKTGTTVPIFRGRHWH